MTRPKDIKWLGKCVNAYVLINSEYKSAMIWYIMSCPLEVVAMLVNVASNAYAAWTSNLHGFTS